MSTAYLLDTNLLSELRRKRPNQGIEAFGRATDNRDQYISVISLGELRKGVAMRRRRGYADADELEIWVTRVEEEFKDRTLPVDSEVAKVWGLLASDRSRPVADTLIAATALVHNLVLVSRNERDFEGLDVTIVNPWE